MKIATAAPHHRWISSAFIALTLMLSGLSAGWAQAQPSAEGAPKRSLSARPKLAPRPAGYGGMLLKMVLSLAIVCVVAFVALKWGLQRFASTQNQDGHMKVLARLNLEPRRALMVAQIGQRILVLSSSEAGIHLLTELDPEDAAVFTSPQDKGANKKSAFEGALAKRRKADAPSVIELDEPDDEPAA